MICSTCFKPYKEFIDCSVVDCPLLPLRRPAPEQDHWTVPDDPEVKSRPGWGWIKLDKLWWFPKLDAFMQWHDRVTKKGSNAQKLGVSVERINEAQHEMLKEQGTAGAVVDSFLKRVQRFFYEGKLR